MDLLLFWKAEHLCLRRKGGWWATDRAQVQCSYNVQDKHSGGARYSAPRCFSNTLNHHPFTRYHSEAATVTCNLMNILPVAHRAHTPKRAHRYREKQEEPTVTPPQLKFKGFYRACISKASLTRVITCHWGPFLSFRGTVGRMCTLHAQRAIDALQNKHHLFLGDISYCKIREDVVQVFFEAAWDHLSQPQKELSYFPFNGLISHNQKVRARILKIYI